MQALARYTVELRRPQDGWEHLQEAAGRAREVAKQMQAEGVPVRFLRSVFVPEDDICFLLYEAPSAEAVRIAVRRADLTAVRQLQAIEADARRAVEEEP